MHSYRVGSLSGIPIPASVDWTKSGILGPVKMQAANGKYFQILSCLFGFECS